MNLPPIFANIRLPFEPVTVVSMTGKLDMKNLSFAIFLD
jgi:hypothetical protein